MRLASKPSLSFGSLLCIVALLAAAATADPVRLSGDRLLIADASPFASNGIASQLPPQDRLVTSDDRDTPSTPRRVQSLSSSAFSVSDLETASHNVKAVAHVGINLILDLAYSNSLVGYLIGNETSAVIAKSESPRDIVNDGSAASPRRQITGMSVALIVVMIFFAVYM